MTKSITLIELLMEYVAPIVGSLAFAWLLMTWTALPRWACIIIAIPLGTVTMWALIIGLIFLAGRLARTDQTKDSDEQADAPKSATSRP